MVILLNDKELEVALKELAEPKRKTRDKGGKFYWGIDEFVTRMNDVFGRGGYSVQYQMEPPFVFPLTNQVMMNATCTINLLGKDGQIVYSVMGCGGKQIDKLAKTYKVDGKEVERPEEERFYNELNNLAYNVQSAAFKSACKSLDIFGCASKEEDGNNTASYSNSSNKGASNASASAGSGQTSKSFDTQKVKFYVKDKIVNVKEDPKTHEPIYRMYGYEIVHNAELGREVCREEKTEIVFYPNRYKDCKETMESYVKKETPYKVTLEIKKNSDGKSYTFFGFAGGDR